jgi:hypothetical protein
MDRLDEARQAYQLAVSSLSQVGSRPYLNMKLADLTFPLMDNPGEAAPEATDLGTGDLETIDEGTVVEETTEDTAEKAILSPEEEQ